MQTLLIEIGSEEIPAGYIEPALKALSSMLLKKLTDARIDHGEARFYGTPRRLAVEVLGVADKQKPLVTEVTGPPKNVGFDAQGNPTTAAIKFAEKIGVPVGKIKVKETRKGLYLWGEKKERGIATRTFLKDILPDVILDTPFPKTMRWADLGISFARPIQWVLALYGERVLSFELGNLKSGRNTYGHRFMHPGKLKIASPDAYREALRSGRVIVDPSERKTLIDKEISTAAEKLGGKVLSDPELLGIVTHLVEQPAISVGKFDTKFLALPDDVLITAMREHQKYFAVVDPAGKLMPYFIAVNNTTARDMDMVAKGHERVLRARLEDAKFFYSVDLEVSLEKHAEKLKDVSFQAQLGTMYDKVVRVGKVAGWIAAQVNDNSGLERQVARSAQLCKADLVSQMVAEFPKLQGIMGSIYALVQGEPATVAAAIEEHYRPVYSGAPLPKTRTGAVLSIADKIDSICGCFNVGLIPTGAADPYALRRQGIGIIQIILDQGFSFSLAQLIEQSLKHFERQHAQNFQENAEKVSAFLQHRMAHLLTEEGFSKDAIQAVLGVSADCIPEAWRKVQALEKLKSMPDFEPLAAAFKRVVNIIKKADAFRPAAINENLFEHESESALVAAFNAVKSKVEADLHKGFFDQALIRIASLRDPVDAFFDDVMVMAEDMNVRRNRLSILGNIAALFEKIADFSKISI